MNCKADGCEQVLTGRQREFCSDKCRMRQSRTNKTPEVGSGSTNANKMVLEPEQIKPEQRSRTVAIPGGADYEGCCRQVGDGWVVDNTKPNIKAMNTDELIRRLHYIKDWQYSPEHREVLRRRMEAA